MKDEELKIIKDDMSILEKRLADTEEKIEYIQKENNLLVDRIKEEINENTHQTAIDFIQNKMGVDVGQHQICEVYRVG